MVGLGTSRKKERTKERRKKKKEKRGDMESPPRQIEAGWLGAAFGGGGRSRHIVAGDAPLGGKGDIGVAQHGVFK